MASIGTAIRLNDMMTAPITSITNAMNMMLSTWMDLDSATAGGLDINGVENIRAELNKATQALDQMGNKQQKFNRHVQQGDQAMDGLTDKILGAVGAFAGLQGLKALVGLSDTFTQTQARLAMIVDEGSNVEEMTNKIFASAQRARTGYQGMADMVAKLSLQAGDAFKSNDEAILFVENLNKMYTIAGTSVASMESANLQLTQALGSGVLRGEEFNAVFEAAPNVMEAVADYIGKPVGKLREMAAEGQITADIVKNALLSATGEINDQFESMPMTWGQVWTGVMNELYYASIPLLEAISWMTENWSVLEPIVIGAATAVGLYTGALLIYKGVTAGMALAETVRAAATMMSTGATFAATAAQHGFNAALLASPITWVILIIIALVGAFYALIAAINKTSETTHSATGYIMGAFAVLGAFLINTFIVPLWNMFASLVNFIGNAFNDPVAAIKVLFYDMVLLILDYIGTLAEGIETLLNKIPGVTVDITAGLDRFHDQLKAAQQEVKDESGWVEYVKKMEFIEYDDAGAAGYAFGEGVADKVGGMFGGDTENEYGMDALTQSVGGIEDATGAISDSLDVSNENLKYLRDAAEQEVINRFTTAEIRVELGGVTNNVNQNTDLDGVMDYFVGATQEAMERVAEGVHS